MRYKLFGDEFTDSEDHVFRNRIDERVTLVGYTSPPGHNHDDNCLTRAFICSKGHTYKIGKRRKCNACNWVGMKTCSCHEGRKVDEWPTPEAPEPEPKISKS
jgi:hypothetical protein